jgi:hypothetical protein
MPATILTFVRRQPTPPEPGGESAPAADGLPQAPLSTPVGPALPTARQLAHRWAMLAHLKQVEEGVPPGTVR